jgi:phage terminase large subunit GpA-like protein
MLNLATSYARSFSPRDRREVDAWAREYVKVGAWSPWEGDFSTDHTPWIVQPLRILGRQGPRRLTIVGPAAGGKSTIGEVFLAWAIDNAPGFVVWYAQDEEAAKEFAETRVQRFLASCDRVSRWFPSSRHARRTQAIHFPHMSFVIQAANTGNAQSKHIRHLICDEPWLYKPGMLAALHKRTTRFAHNRTILEMSTGSLKGDEVDQAWNQGTRQEWQLFCPKCEQHHTPRWTFGRVDSPGGVKWDAKARREDGTWDIRAVAESTEYECPKCQARFAANAANGYALNSRGQYSEPAADAMPTHWSFHWNCIASDFAQLGAIAVEFLQAKAALRRGTTALLQEFTQKKLAEAWEDQAPEVNVAQIDSDYKMGEPWTDEFMRFLLVDVQQTHFWALIRSFSKDGRSRLVSVARLESWESIEAWRIANAVAYDCTFVDSGDLTDAVYMNCARYGWFAIKGEEVPGGYLVVLANSQKVRVVARASDALGIPAQLGPGSKNKACRLFLISDSMSSEILAKARAGKLEGWTIASDTPQFYRQQLASMVKISQNDKLTNRVRWFWKEIGKAGNHCWDIERYAIAAAFLAGLFRITEPEAPAKTEPVKP